MQLEFAFLLGVMVLVGIGLIVAGLVNRQQRRANARTLVITGAAILIVPVAIVGWFAFIFATWTS